MLGCVADAWSIMAREDATMAVAGRYDQNVGGSIDSRLTPSENAR